MTVYGHFGLLCRANLEATQRIGALALEAGATVWRLEVAVAQERLQNSSEALRAFPATTTDERDVVDPFVDCREIMKQALEAAWIWVEAADKARADLSRIAGFPLPAAGQSLIEAWLSAAKAGHEVSAVTESHHGKIAESPTPKAA